MRSALSERPATSSADCRCPTWTPPHVVLGATQKSTAKAGAAVARTPQAATRTRRVRMRQSSALRPQLNTGADRRVPGGQAGEFVARSREKSEAAVVRASLGREPRALEPLAVIGLRGDLAAPAERD